MQVFKAFFKVAKKQLASASIYIIIFLVLAIALGNMGSSNSVKSFSTTSLDIAVENQDDGILGAALIDYLGQSNDIVDIPESEDKLLDKMYTREIEYVLYIPEDFTEKVKAEDYKNLLTTRKVPSSAYSELADSQVEAYMKSINMYLIGGFSVEEAIEKAQKNLKLTADVEFMKGETKIEKGREEYYFQYMPYIMICSMIIVLGPVLIAFKRREINARNRCSALSGSAQNMQQILGSICITIAEFLLLVGAITIMAPSYVFSVKGALSVANAFLAALLAVGLTFLIAQFATKTEVLEMMSNVIGLGFAFLGGIFVPLDLFSDNVIRVSKFVPTYWYVQVNDALMKVTEWNHIPSAVPQGMGIQVVFIAAIFCAALAANRMKARTA